MPKEVFSFNRTVFTTGYEGKDIEEFLEHLIEYEIEQVIDVREIPLSRKKGFSKTKLQQRLAKNNIDYIHVRELGSPTELRRKVYKDKDFDYFFEKYEEYLEDCRGELEELHHAINKKLSCLLCFEENHSNCHRSAVANRVSRMNGTSLEVRHI